MLALTADIGHLLSWSMKKEAAAKHDKHEVAGFWRWGCE